MNKVKAILWASIFALLSMGIYVNATCTATAYGCTGVSCSVTAPPGGYTQCNGTSRSATCRAYDAAGNQCKFIRCYCPSPGIPTACLQMIPTC
jgi:hypothetical protein